MSRQIRHPKWYLIITTLFLLGCSNNHFIIYSMNGQIADNKSNNFNINSSFNLYLNRNDITQEYEEINIIATNNFYYGQFFFDSIFMDMLKTKTHSINADAIIYEKDKKDFPFYNDEYLYFTAIRYKNKSPVDMKIHNNGEVYE